MLGRTEGNGAPTSGATANGMAAPQTPGVESTAVPDPMSARAASEPMPASVNVTVLIAMPSPSTVFAPSFKRAHATSPMTGVLRSPSSSATFAGAAPGKLDEADEEAGDDLPSVKGKARRAPSFRSVRSTRSAVADARREAFFGPEAGRVNPAEVAPALGIDDDEDEELPELVFGTASVPILASAPAGANPTQADLLGLVNLAKTTREAAARLETEAKPVTGQKTKETVGDETMTTADDHLRGAGQDLEAQRAGTGDVVGRVLREAEPHEALGRPSGSGWRTSSVLSSTDGLGLGFGGADRSGAPTPATADPLLGSRLSLSAASRYSAHVPPSTGADASLGNAPASASASAVAFEPALSFSSEGAGVPLEAPVEKKDGREEAEQFVIADPEDEVRAPSAPAPQQRTTAERVPNTTTAYPA